MPPSTPQKIADLHAAYCRITGFRLSLDMMREQLWYEWVTRGLTVQDLTDLIGYHRRLASKGQPARSLVFRTLIGRPDYAEEDLAVMRAGQRTPRMDPAKAEVLQATGRPTSPQDAPARAAGEVLPPERLAGYIAELRKAAGTEGKV